ncbi:SDR family oxidoreductase [Saccharothrix sp. NPDC042600]|uniref:SDR family oxidoreductase n=1 Tax=Saccharothrix TaxID=2071 RepID=UPI0033CD16A3|nr:hypothetical protein GCM10017745_58300 [Saccharothrix mutabilis subsp. capreolus]
MNVLILGGTGFVGAGIARTLARTGAAVRVLSRGGATPVGEGVRGDVRLPDLGLSGDALAAIRAQTTHVVLTFGSVSWAAGPDQVLQTHAGGTRSALEFLRTLPRLEQAVHISSLLSLGRAKGRVTNRELYTGQGFRNWYEYGKYCAERLVRDAADLPVGAVRFGPVAGADPFGRPIDTSYGLPAVLPHLLAGYPVPARHGGEFPCWITDVSSAAEIVLKALTAPIGRDVWTWFDPALPSLRRVFTEVCRPWGVVPRIVEGGRGLRRLTALVSDRIGLPREVVAYLEPWFDVDPDVLRDVPRPWPAPDPDYLADTGRALLGGGS